MTPKRVLLDFGFWLGLLLRVPLAFGLLVGLAICAIIAAVLRDDRSADQNIVAAKDLWNWAVVSDRK